MYSFSKIIWYHVKSNLILHPISYPTRWIHIYLVRNFHSQIQQSVSVGLFSNTFYTRFISLQWWRWPDTNLGTGHLQPLWRWRPIRVGHAITNSLSDMIRIHVFYECNMKIEKERQRKSKKGQREMEIGGGRRERGGMKGAEESEYGENSKSRNPWWRHQNGNIFRVTGPLCGEFTGYRWIHLTKASDAELWYFLWSTPD